MLEAKFVLACHPGRSEAQPNFWEASDLTSEQKREAKPKRKLKAVTATL